MIGTHDVYTVQNVGSGLNLEVFGWSKANGASVDQWSATGGANQQWVVRSNADGTVSLIGANNYLALEMPNGNASNGAPAGQWAYWGGSYQKWRVVPRGAYVQLVNAGSGACLEVPNGNNGSGTRLDQWGCWGGNYQVWKFVPRGSTTLAPPLHTSGNRIVDRAGTARRLRSINWFGASDQHSIVQGLQANQRDAMAQLMVSMGFDSVRLPFSNVMVERQPVVSDANLLRANPDLLNQNAWQIFEETVATLDRNHLGIILNNHTTSAMARPVGYDSPCDTKWYNTDASGCELSLSADQFVADWVYVVRNLSKYPMVIGVDLRNEVRDPGVSWSAWKQIVQRTEAAIHAVNPNLLIVVEGLSYSGDITGAYRDPVQLSVPNTLVYSPHTYAWYNFLAPNGLNYDTESYAQFVASMNGAWGNLLQPGQPYTAPIWMGEFGIYGGAPGNYLGNVTRYINDTGIGFAYWAFPAIAPDGSRESYSLINASFDTALNDERLRALQQIR